MEDFFGRGETYEIFWGGFIAPFGAMKQDAIRRFVCDEWVGDLRSEMGLDRLEHTPRHSQCKIFEWMWSW